MSVEVQATSVSVITSTAPNKVRAAAGKQSTDISAVTLMDTSQVRKQSVRNEMMCTKRCVGADFRNWPIASWAFSCYLGAIRAVSMQ
jgi:hypothetical protein